MKKNIFLSIFCIFLFSCTDKGVDIPEINTSSDNQKPIQKMGADGEWDVLGFGYDLSGAYLHPASVKNAVINIKQLATDYPDKLYWNASTYGYNSYTYGYNSEDYLTEKTEEVTIDASVTYGALADLQLFSGTFSYSGSFNSKQKYSSIYMFASCDAVKNVKRIYLTADMNLLMNYLNPSFVQDLNTKSADEIVNTYGTSVLTDFTIGGRISFIYRSADNSQMTSDSRKSTVKAGLNATLGLLSVSTDATVSQQTINTYNSNNKSRSLNIEYFGGEGTGASYNLETGFPTVNISAWETSVNKNNAALTKVDWTKAIPIWEFTTDPVKKSLLTAAVVKHIKDSEIKCVDLVPITGAKYSKSRITYYFPVGSIGIGFDQTALINIVKKTDQQLTINNAEILGYVFKNQEPNTQPLYLYIKNITKNSGDTKCLYTTQKNVTDINYKYIGCLGYVYITQLAGSSLPQLPSGYNYSSYIEGLPYYVYVP